MFFGLGEKVFFTDCVFEKLCFSENIICVVFSAKHSSCNKSLGCKQKYENGLFLSMAKRCFFNVFFFLVLMFLWFVFWCVW